jgi:YVTN family beta-propeller protein
VDVLSDATNTVVATVPVGQSPDGVAYDPGLGEVGVANGASGDLTEISDATNSVVASIHVGGAPDALAFDSGLGEVFVTQPGVGWDNVSVISVLENQVVASIRVGTYPDGIAYDAVRGELFVTNADSDSVDVLSDATNTVVATVPVGQSPDGVAYDPGLGEVGVANGASGDLTEISDATNSVVATLPIGSDPRELVWDPALELFEVSDYSQGTMSLISPGPTTYLFTVNETGLPPSQPWYLNVSGSLPVVSPAPYAVINLTNGSYTYTVSTPNTVYHPSLAGGKINVSGAPVLNRTRFLATSYTIPFIESGLPSGTNWSVIFDGVFASSISSSLSFRNVTNGSYDFEVDPVVGFVASPPGGVDVIDGPPTEAQAVIFAPHVATVAPPPAAQTDALIGGVFALVAVVAVLVSWAVWRRMRRKPDDDWYSSNE